MSKPKPTDQTLDSRIDVSMCSRTHRQPFYPLMACRALQRGRGEEQIVHQGVTGFKSMTRGLEEG